MRARKANIATPAKGFADHTAEKALFVEAEFIVPKTEYWHHAQRSGFRSDYFQG